MRLQNQFGADQQGRDWDRHWSAEGFAALERMAGAGPFLGGGAPDIADVCLVPQMYNARRLELPLAAYPALVRADAAATALPAIAAAHPDRARSEEHTSELQSLMRISYAVFCLKKKKNQQKTQTEISRYKPQTKQQYHT